MRMRPVLAAALEAVDPYAAVRNALWFDGDSLTVAGESIPLDQVARVIVVGAGKAGEPMVRAVAETLTPRALEGCVVVKYGYGDDSAAVPILQAGHPLPDAQSLAAGAAILDLAMSALEDDLVICLLSGGGSALLEALPEPLTLQDLQETTELLLACGATIQEMNAVRKHLSSIKGGQLARVIAPARLVTLILSDVVGSPLDVIASGPTTPDAATWADAWGVVERYELFSRLPAAVRERLRAGLDGTLPDTPKSGDPVFDRVTTVIVGDNAVAAEAAGRAAERQGFNPLILTTFLEGEAREAARAAVAVAREIHAFHRPIEPPACLILGGETTVTLGDAPGRGGRNQELALSAALALEGSEGITLVALATDGNDGPTDAAGGCVDGATAAWARSLGLDPVHALQAHDAYPLLEAAGALLKTGPTRTNVNDLIFVFVDEARSTENS